jgi:methylthioribose-1-phosphate isomerase
VDAIGTLSVRGAPAVGVAAAMGLAALAGASAASHPDLFRESIRHWASLLRHSRPTAVNLRWAVDRVLAAASDSASPHEAALAMRATADAIRDEDRAMCRSIGERGADLLADGMTVLTHCNTGALATAGIGTALAAIYVAHERGMRLNVIASETRPLLQGSRLTAWELGRAGIPVTVVTEGAVASLFQRGQIDCCIVGADRIARNGDVANKIGTLSHALIAHVHNLPFYVAAPRSTIDVATADGGSIHIEDRPGAEVLGIAGASAHLAGVAVLNPAFDVTPAPLITAIVTDSGVHRPPYDFSRD